MQSVRKESPSQQTTRSEFSRSMGVGDKAASDQPSAELERENTRVPGIGAASGVAIPGSVGSSCRDRDNQAAHPGDLLRRICR